MEAELLTKSVDSWSVAHHQNLEDIWTWGKSKGDRQWFPTTPGILWNEMSKNVT